MLTNISALTITLSNNDAIVWAPQILVTGQVEPAGATGGIMHVNQRLVPFAIDPASGDFTVECDLDDGINSVWGWVATASDTAISDTLTFTIRYNIKPEIYAYASIIGTDLVLTAEVIDNPDSSSITYLWIEDSGNPASVTISSPIDSVTNVNISDVAPAGEYYFDLKAFTSNSDTVVARTYFTKKNEGIFPFQILEDHAAWIDTAVIYEITPYNFVQDGQFWDITAKIPELVELGINTIWIQPIYDSYYGGQGYDVIDFFNVRDDLGGEAALTDLIQTARDHGLRVLFDIVLNHSSIHHPYAEETVNLGTASHYFDFYQRTFDSAPYSINYHLDSDGFIYYFWDNLPNLNYDNPEVRKWMTEACRFWIEKYDIDGYRFDAIWGVNARRPDFASELRLSLKRIKPEILLLAEDQATSSSVFDQRFDAAFDWDGDQIWVSKWSWQIEYSEYNSNLNKTIFNQALNWRTSRLSGAITNNGNFFPEGAKILRFMENNDKHRFIRNHGLARTKMVAGLIFSLPGLPMIYNGQEIGTTTHPYLDNYIFILNSTIQSHDFQGLFPYYRQLADLRLANPSLYSDNFAELVIAPNSYTYVYHRWADDDHSVVLLNMGDSQTNITVGLPGSILDVISDGYQFYDLVSDLYPPIVVDSAGSFSILLDPYSIRILNLRERLETEEDNVSHFPREFQLSQNFPNPFNSSTVIKYTLPSAGKVEFTVYNLLGRAVESIKLPYQSTGSHTIRIDREELGSGIYFYRLNSESRQATRKMIIIK